MEKSIGYDTVGRGTTGFRVGVSNLTGYDTVGCGRAPARPAVMSSNQIGYFTAGCGRAAPPSAPPADVMLEPIPITATATTANSVISRRAPDAHRE
ncbi:hypothetical protein [Streptomyces sp. NPDC014006]|uniref:hypothetical protein n=1 Tax=Streptomyces sp. NPDC014006 TaxID=3364870 RepID=UPI0036FC7411